RTTIRLDAGILREAKRLGIESGRTLTEVIADALRAALAQRRAPHSTIPELPISSRRGGVVPGVNLDSTADLLERMEEK
ncbi:MAG: hypothetical protein ACRD2D_09655, partial [Terriglobales bacterium]